MFKCFKNVNLCGIYYLERGRDIERKRCLHCEFAFVLALSQNSLILLTSKSLIILLSCPDQPYPLGVFKHFFVYFYFCIIYPQSITNKNYISYHNIRMIINIEYFLNYFNTPGIHPDILHLPRRTVQYPGLLEFRNNWFTIRHRLSAVDGGGGCLRPQCSGWR